MLTYNGIYSILTKLFRSRKITLTDVKSNFAPFIPPLYNILVKNVKCNKHIYKLLNDKDIIPTAFNKWNNSYDFNINPRDVFNICFNTSADTSIHWLQYRIIHRILPVRKYLKKIKAINNDICFFCDHDVESIEHVFFFCDTASSIWDNLEYMIFNMTNHVVHFNVKDVLFGKVHDEYAYVLNFIILFTKQYIYKNLKKHCYPSMMSLLNYLKFNYQIHLHIARKNKCIEKFEANWNNWKDLFDI